MAYLIVWPSKKEFLKLHGIMKETEAVLVPYSRL